MTSIALFGRGEQHGDRPAIESAAGTLTYRQLLDRSARTAGRLLDGATDLGERRVAFITPAGADYPILQWGIWRAGGIAVPLSLHAPRPELEYVIEDAGADTLIVHPDYRELLAPIAQSRKLRLLTVADAQEGAPVPLPDLSLDRRAMIVYTSGTTSRPKGVVSTHGNIEAQVTALIEAWEWSSDDHILHCLPLHHVHGIINILTCALWAGATCEILPRFEAEEVWRRLTAGRSTLFMAVPTIYTKLIASWQANPASQRERSDACRKLRLMVSGSAALPVSVLEQWREITGHTLLERYGMTEIGMALSNPLHGERRPGTVGKPLPRVEVRLVNEQGQPVETGSPGEIEVRGPAVFHEYWNRPDATPQAFRDGWFRTGDVAVLEDGYYRILGRSSVDIIKTGGYKVSALEIEEVLRTHPAIAECAVVGLPDEQWGERIAAAVVLRPDSSLTLDDLRAWSRERLATYKLPSQLLALPELPRNAMGKVSKPQVTPLFH